MIIQLKQKNRKGYDMTFFNVHVSSHDCDNIFLRLRFECTVSFLNLLSIHTICFEDIRPLEGTFHKKMRVIMSER